MKSKELRDEILEMLLAGAELFITAKGRKLCTTGEVVLTDDEVRALMKERACNIAQALAHRTLSQKTSERVFADLEG